MSGDQGAPDTDADVVSLAALDDTSVMDARLRTLLGYWAVRGRGDQLPRRTDIDPLLDLPHLAPDLFMVDVVSGGADFTVRLVGTRVVERYGADSTGQSIGALTVGRYRTAVLALMRAAVRERRPVWSFTNYLHPDRSFLSAERLMMPLVDDAGDVTILLVIQVFDSPPDVEPEPLRTTLEQVQQTGSRFKFTAYIVTDAQIDALRAAGEPS